MAEVLLTAAAVEARASVFTGTADVQQVPDLCLAVVTRGGEDVAIWMDGGKEGLAEW